MAQHFFGVSRGPDSFPAVTVGTSDTGKEVQIVTIDGTLNRKDAVLLARAIIEWLNTNQAGPSSAFPI